jgi:hypothetical protein
MSKKLWAIILSLMLAFSFSLITGCQKANEKTGGVKAEATESKVEIKKETVKTVKEVTVEEIKEKAVEPAEKNKEMPGDTVKRITVTGIKKKTVETDEKNKQGAAETVEKENVKEVKEKAVVTADEIDEEVTETVTGITVEKVTGIPAATAEEIKAQAIEADEEAEEKLDKPAPPIETKTFPAPTLIAQPDDMRSTVSVTLRWNPVRSPYGNSVKYFVRLYSGDGIINPSGWILGTNWTRTITRPCNYTWQVKARDNVNLQESAWSTTDSFLVNTHCSEYDN